MGTTMHNRTNNLRWLAATLLAALPGMALAGQFPLWEAGAGLALINFPDYRGSDERNNYALPVPYVVYRGEVLQVDRQKVRGLFFKSDSAELDFSLNGSVPVKSDSNRARKGMPNLDPTLEAGPSLNFFLHRSQDQRFNLDLRLPLRAVYAIDLPHARHTGWLFHPQLNLDLLNVGPGRGWNLGFAAGPLFADQRYHRYFYTVEPAYATAERPAYAARGGYAGTQLVAAVSKRFPNFWFGAFVKADTLRGAAFADSPLVKTKQSMVGGFAISWIFSQSGTIVEARE